MNPYDHSALNFSTQKKPTSFGIKDRKRFFSFLDHKPEPVFDICVVGGGITGAAIARDAAMRGLSVLLVEKNDFAWGTSSRSSKLVHGGVRYLENLEFKLVFESTHERALLWKNAPDLCKPIAFLFPAYKNSRLPLSLLNLGLWLYDVLSGFGSPTLHKKLSAKKLSRLEPTLHQSGLKGAIYYWDGATDDALLTLANIIDAQNFGAMCLSKTKLKSIAWRKDGTSPHTLTLTDTMNQSTHTAQARVVIGATGPWIDELHTSLKVFDHSKRMATTRGSHIVVKKEKLPLNHAIVMTHPKDGRVLFAIPWNTHTVVGTTDIYDNCNPDDVLMTPQESKYLMDAALSFFPAHPISINDVVSTWTGLRPLLAPEASTLASEVSRDHELKWDERGYLYITGGKLTTHREMAKQAVDTALSKTIEWEQPLSEAMPRCPTKHAPLASMIQASKNIIKDFSIETFDQADETFVREMIQTQMILSLEDFFVRRTEIFYKHDDNGISLISKLKPIFVDELELSEDQWTHMVANYYEFLKKNIELPLERTLTKDD